MKHPAQWRETVDPFSLAYHAFQPTEILGYPHAGNDVFHAKGIYQGREVTAYIKAARQKDAAIENEVAILSRLHAPVFPSVIDFGFDGTPFSVTLELQGERLSAILGENDGLASLQFMEEYGAALSKLHRHFGAAFSCRDFFIGASFKVIHEIMFLCELGFRVIARTVKAVTTWPLFGK